MIFPYFDYPLACSHHPPPCPQSPFYHLHSPKSSQKNHSPKSTGWRTVPPVMVLCCGLTRDNSTEWTRCTADGPYRCSVPQAAKTELCTAKEKSQDKGVEWSFERGGNLMLCAECVLVVTMAHLTPLLNRATSKQCEFLLLCSRSLEVGRSSSSILDIGNMKKRDFLNDVLKITKTHEGSSSDSENHATIFFASFFTYGHITMIIFFFNSRRCPRSFYHPPQTPWDARSRSWPRKGPLVYKIRPISGLGSGGVAHHHDKKKFSTAAAAPVLFTTPLKSHGAHVAEVSPVRVLLFIRYGQFLVWVPGVYRHPISLGDLFAIGRPTDRPTGASLLGIV